MQDASGRAAACKDYSEEHKAPTNGSELQPKAVKEHVVAVMWPFTKQGSETAPAGG